jgi:hypothetical protein
MNISHKHKLIWWATSRCASRFTSRILGPLQFYNYDDNEITKHPFFDLIYENDGQDLKTTSFSHKLILPEGVDVSGYRLIANIRNPYDVFYSNYRLENIEYLRGKLKRTPDESEIIKSFVEWGTSEMQWYYKNIEQIKNAWDIYDLQTSNGVDYLIRYEHLIDDIMSIPDISNLYKTNIDYRYFVDSIITQPYGGFRVDLPLAEQTFKDVFTQELADFIYDRYKYQFDIFGYDKDSWKK